MYLKGLNWVVTALGRETLALPCRAAFAAFASKEVLGLSYGIEERDLWSELASLADTNLEWQLQSGLKKDVIQRLLFFLTIYIILLINTYKCNFATLHACRMDRTS